MKGLEYLVFVLSSIGDGGWVPMKVLKHKA